MLDLSGGNEQESFSEGAIDELGYQDEEAIQAAADEHRLDSEDLDGASPADIDAQVAAEAVATSLQDADLPTNPGASSSSSSAAPPPPPPPTQVDRRTVDDLVGPYPSGRVYLRDERTIGSIIRGKPKNSLAVACKFHPKCSFLLPLRCAPTDEALKEWFSEVPEVEKTDTPAEKARKAKQHMALAQRWRDQ